MKFIHCADIHLDSPLRGLEKYDGAPSDNIRGATRRALENLVEFAIEQEVDFIIIAGDIYDGDWKDYNTGLFFIRQMERLNKADIPVFMIRGNHDALSQITKELRLPQNVVNFDHRKAETTKRDSLGVAVHGQSYASQSVTTELHANYPPAVPGMFNIGVLHTSADGREGHEPYAPCTVAGLKALGYDYWALGHIHKREVLCESPYILFPGNLQGRHIRETGPKGCTLVEVTPAHVISAQHIDLDVVRWHHIKADITGCDTMNAALDEIRIKIGKCVAESDGRLVCARITAIGSTIIHDQMIADQDEFTAKVRSEGLAFGAEVWIEKVKIETSSLIDLEQLAQRNDPIGELVRLTELLESDSELCAEFAATFKDLRDKLPPELKRQEEMQNFASPEMIRALVPDARQILLPALLKGDSDN